MKLLTNLFFKISTFLLLIGLYSFSNNGHAQCSWMGVRNDSVAAPTAQNPTITTTCVTAGNYATVSGLQAGNVYKFSTCNSNASFDTQLELFTTGGGTSIAFNDNACWYYSEISILIPASGDYDIMLYDYYCAANAACAPIEITFLGLPPSNDKPCDAIAVSANGTVFNFTNVAAGLDSNELAANPPIFWGTAPDQNNGWATDGLSNSVWFKFTAPSTAIDIDACGSSFDTQIAIYEVGDCNDFSTYHFIAGNEDGSSCSVYQSHLFTNCVLTPGNDYYLVVDGWFNLSGDVSFTISPFNFPAPVITDMITSAPSCLGGGNGFASITLAPNILGRIYTYSWSNGAENLGTFDEAGPITVSVTDLCGSVVSQTDTIPDGKPFIADAGPDFVICKGETAVLGPELPPLNVKAYGFNSNNQLLYRFDLANPSTLKLVASSPVYPTYIFGGEFTPYGLLGFNVTKNELVRIDTTTGELYSIIKYKPINNGQWQSLAWNAVNNKLYGISTSASLDSNFNYIYESTLYALDPVMGHVSVIGSENNKLDAWLAIDTAGVAYTLDMMSDSLAHLDLNTGLSTPIGGIGFNTSYAQDASFHPITNELYLASMFYDGITFLSQLYVADVNTGNTILIDTIGAGNDELTAFAITANTELPSYSWVASSTLSNTSIANPTASPTTTTEYILSVTDVCGNVSADTAIVAVFTQPDANFQAVNTGSNYLFVAMGNCVGCNYFWDFGDGSTSTLMNPSHIYANAGGDFTATLIASSLCGSDTFSVMLTVLGINEALAQYQMTVTPNPSQANFMLNMELANPEKVALIVTDLQGKVIFTQEEKQAMGHFQTNLALENVADGIYFLEIITEKGVIRSKLIKEGGY